MKLYMVQNVSAAAGVHSKALTASLAGPTSCCGIQTQHCFHTASFLDAPRWRGTGAVAFWGAGMELQLSSPSCPCLPGRPSRNSSQFSEHLGFLLISFSQHHQQSLALKRGRGGGSQKLLSFLKKESLCIWRTLSCEGRLHSPLHHPTQPQ